jgi:hypothetical protein
MAFLLLLWCCSEKYKLYFKKRFYFIFSSYIKKSAGKFGNEFIVRKKTLFLFLFRPPPENILEKIREPNNKTTLALQQMNTTTYMYIN